MSGQIIPGMAEAIEARRREVGLTIGDFADEAGVTRQGLDPIRRGVRRGYQDKLKFGVARALQWPSDAIDRLMAGDDPSTFAEVTTRRNGHRTVEDRLSSLEARFDRVEAAIERIEAARPPA